MERKAGGSTAAVEAEAVRAALGWARTLSPEEERALRMRYGGRPETGAPLPSAAGGNPELEDELLLIEMQLTKAWRLRQQGRLPQPVASRTKDKIVRALRRRK
jgi:hypothetical protein